MPNDGTELSEQEHSKGSPTMFAAFVRWLQVKKYQYDVTLALYMLTPTERLIFSMSSDVMCLDVGDANSYTDMIMLVLISLLMTATVYYLPNHLALVSSRLWYYIHGDAFYDTMIHGSSTSVGLGSLKETVTSSLYNAHTVGAGKAVTQNMHEL